MTLEDKLDFICQATDSEVLAQQGWTRADIIKVHRELLGAIRLYEDINRCEKDSVVIARGLELYHVGSIVTYRNNNYVIKRVRIISNGERMSIRYDISDGAEHHYTVDHRRVERITL